MPQDLVQYGFYAVLLVASGAAEYFHLAPMGTMVAIFGLVTGHFFGNGATKSVLSGIANNVATITAIHQTEASVSNAPTQESSSKQTKA